MTTKSLAERDMLLKVKPLYSEARRSLVHHLRVTATQMIVQFAPCVHEDEMYRTVIYPEQFDTMYAASKLMVEDTYNNTFTTPTVIDLELSMKVKYTIIYREHIGHTQWLWPKLLNFISNNTELGAQLIPVVLIVRRWINTIKLVDELFARHRPAMVMHLMPWLKSFIQNEIIDSKSNVMGFSDLNKLLDLSTPRVVPGMSRWFNNALVDGGALLAQYTMVKNINRELPKDFVLVTPVLDDNLSDININLSVQEFNKTCAATGIPVLGYDSFR